MESNFDCCDSGVSYVLVMKRMDHIVELRMFNVYWKADPGLQHNHCFMFPGQYPYVNEDGLNLMIFFELLLCFGNSSSFLNCSF